MCEKLRRALRCYICLQLLDQCAETAQRRKAARTLLEHFTHRGPKRNAALLCEIAQRISGLGADPARRRIQHAEQGDIVFGVEGKARVRERVLYFCSLIETESAYNLVANAELPHGVLKTARLEVRAIKHG